MKKYSALILVGLTLTLASCGGGSNPVPPVVTTPTYDFAIASPTSLVTNQGATTDLTVRITPSDAPTEGVVLSTVVPSGLTVVSPNIVLNQDIKISFSADDSLAIGKYLVQLKFKSGNIEKVVTIEVSVGAKLPGSAYKSFGNNGSVYLGTSNTRNTAVVAALDANKQTVIGYQIAEPNGTNKRFKLTRLSDTGVVDNKFSDASPEFGAAVNIDQIIRVIITPSQKIILVAMNGGRPVLYRLNSDGSLDASYGNDGQLLINDYASLLGFQVNSVAVNTDNSIVLLNSFIPENNFDARIIKFDAEGNINRSFASNGQLLLNLEKPVAHFAAIRYQSDGKMLVARSMSNGNNYDYAVTRLNANGSRDSSFGNNGTVLIDRNAADQNAYGFVVNSSDEIYILGRDGIAQEIIRLSKDGALNTNFGENGFFRLPPLVRADGIISNGSDLFLYNDRFQGMLVTPNAKLTEIKLDVPIGQDPILENVVLLNDKIVGLGSTSIGTKAVISSYAK